MPADEVPVDELPAEAAPAEAVPADATPVTGMPSIGTAAVAPPLPRSLRPLGLDQHRLDHQRSRSEEEREALAIARLECRAHRRRIGQRHGQPGVRAVIAQHRPFNDGDAVGGFTLGDEVGPGGADQFGRNLARCRQAALVEADLDRPLTQRARARQPHAVGREHAGERMGEHGGNRERIGDEAGVLATSAAEGHEGVARDVVAALYRDLLDRIGHVGHGDVDEALGQRLGAHRPAGRPLDLGRKSCEPLADDLGVERLVGIRTEDPGKPLGLYPAQHQVGIGDRQRPAAAVAGRSGIGARRVRSDAQPRAVELQLRTATGGHGVDAHHRCPHPDAGNQGLERALVLAGEMRDVGRRAPHVEPDDAIEAGQPRDLGHPDDAACGPRKDGVLALERMGVGQAAARLHELQAHAR